MLKKPITFREKVEARFIRKGRGPCWMWDGSVTVGGYPALNLKHVLFHIYEWERGPIPPGMVVNRLDHREPECGELKYECRHKLCVNPWHFEFVTPAKLKRVNPRRWDPTRTDHTAHYKRVQRARKAQRKEQHDQDRDPKGVDADE